MTDSTAIILAGGIGTRLRPLTYFRPKALVKVHKRPVIEYVVNNLKKSGINQIYINIHHKPVQMMNYIKNAAFFYEPELLGTAGTIKALLPYQSQDFVVCNADTITTLDISEMMKWHKKSGKIATVAWSKDKCTGTMIFNKQIDDYLPLTGMIDDVLSKIKYSKYESIENRFWDVGTFEGLIKAEQEI